MSALHEAMRVAREALPHPLAVSFQDGATYYDWSCPGGCPQTCPVQDRIVRANHVELFDGLGPGQYEIVAGLWGVHVENRTDRA